MMGPAPRLRESTVMTVSRVDPKLLERPVAFTGLTKDWRAWRVRFTAWLSGVDERSSYTLKMAEQRGGDAITSVDEKIRYLDRFLFIQLIGLVQGEYLDMILEAPFGFEAWKNMRGVRAIDGGQKALGH
jgi:hypothetical protein